MPRISLEQAYEPVEVDLFGQEFTTQSITRSVQKEVERLSKGLDDIEDADEAVATMAQLLDLRLAASNGKQIQPSTLIKRKWNADELDVRALGSFIQKITEAEQPEIATDGDRPT